MPETCMGVLSSCAYREAGRVADNGKLNQPQEEAWPLEPEGAAGRRVACIRRVGIGMARHTGMSCHCEPSEPVLAALILNQASMGTIAWRTTCQEAQCTLHSLLDIPFKCMYPGNKARGEVGQVGLVIIIMAMLSMSSQGRHMVVVVMVVVVAAHRDALNACKGTIGGSQKAASQLQLPASQGVLHTRPAEMMAAAMLTLIVPLPTTGVVSANTCLTV